MNPFLSKTVPPAWNMMTAQWIKPAVQESIENAKSALSKIKEQTRENLTYGSTFTALESATDDLSRAWGRVNHLDSVLNNNDQRAALNEMLPTVSEFYASISLDGELWAILKSYAESDAAKTLDSIYRRHIEEKCESFVNAGADLNEVDKTRFAQIQSELSQKTQTFSENVLDSTNDWELIESDNSRLSGLPESSLEAARLDAITNGHGSEESPAYRFTLQFPSLLPVMQYCDDESLRKEIWEASQTIGWKDGYDNTELVREILALRHEKVKLLGFKNFADWTTSRRMAKTGQNALDFTENLHHKIKNAFDQECREMQDYKAKKRGCEPAALEPWETGFWSEQRRQEDYQFNEEELRPYFPLDRVMSGLFDLASQLFNISVIVVPNQAIWHPEVLYYHLTDNKTGELLGTFYADWHPRESKRGGAWMNCFETGRPSTGLDAREPHVGLICGNMTKPIGEEPALMTHNEVLTIFHEFGHLLHQLLSEVKVNSLSGTNVAWDFVELPSQLMENFCWNRDSLDLFARHHQTNEPIPDSLFEKMIAARNYLSATTFMRQLSFGKLDLELHMNTREELDGTWEEISTTLLDGYQTPLNTPSASMVRRFSHLFSGATGYAAGYYSYKWAEVLDADAFTRFENEGILNADVGTAFRESILSKGNSAPPEELFQEFMGREVNESALLKREGLS